MSKILKKIIDYRGKTPKKLGSDWTVSGYRALSALNVKTSGLEKTESIRYVDDDLYRKWMKEEIQRGDILLTSEAPAGQVMVWDSDEKIVLSQRLFALRLNNDFDNYFIKYFLQSDTGQKEIFKNTSGSTVFGISAKMFDLINVPDLKFEDQQKIGLFLKTVDSKIELNNKINAELESMAKAIYDYWFVQFDFPDENGKPYKSSGGKMVWNEELKREIPVGWTSNMLAEWIGTDISGDWGAETPSGNYLKKVTCIRGTDINGVNGLEQCNPPERYILTKNAHKILHAFDLIIEISGGSPVQSTGRLAYLTEKTLERFENPIICSNFCKALTLKDESLFYNFIFHWNRLYENGVFFGYEGKTSGIKNLLFDTFISSHLVIVPDIGIRKKFNELMIGIDARKQHALLENNRLINLRDWLLPMLMNGQVTVSK